MEEKQKHDAYGMISVSRFQTNHNKSFFGSSIKHSGGIEISIYDANVERSLNRNVYFKDSYTPLITVEMSYNQFAEMLTANMNTEGTPCTILYKNGKKIEAPIFENKRIQFEDEFKKDMVDLKEKMSKLVNNTENILKDSKPINKKDKELILKEIRALKQEVEKNIPFVVDQFNKQMDKTVIEAKSDIEGFYEIKIRDLGIQALQDKIKMIEI